MVGDEVSGWFSTSGLEFRMLVVAIIDPERVRFGKVRMHASEVAGFVGSELGPQHIDTVPGD